MVLQRFSCVETSGLNPKSRLRNKSACLQGGIRFEQAVMLKGSAGF